MLQHMFDLGGTMGADGCSELDPFAGIRNPWDCGIPILVQLVFRVASASGIDIGWGNQLMVCHASRC